MVDELLVECSNKHVGCTVNTQRQLLEIHKRESCLFTMVPCAESSCSEAIMRKDLGRHNEICMSREDECEMCGSSVKAADMKARASRSLPFKDVLTFSFLQAHSNRCLEQEINCPSCSASLKRSQIEDHALQCPKAIVKCDHSQYGCHWAGDRQGLPAHIQSCSFESLKGFFHVVDRRFEAVRDENFILRQRLDSAESTIRSIQHDLAKVRKSLGRWCAPGNDAMNLAYSSTDPSGSSTDTSGFDIPRWRASHPLTPLLSFSPEASPISPAHEVADAYSSSIGSNIALSDPSYLAPFFPPTSVGSSTNLADNTEASNSTPLSSSASAHPQIDSILARHMQSQFPLTATRPSLAFPPPPIRFPDVTNPRTNGSNSSSASPSAATGTSNASTANASRVSSLDGSTTLEGALACIQRSVSSVSNAVDALARRTDVALTTENLRMTEEVGALRAIVHGLRMQVHALLSDRNSLGGSGWAGLGSGSVMTTTTATYLNHPPPPTHVPLVINSTSTTSTTKL